MKITSYILIAVLGLSIFPVSAHAAIYWDSYLGGFANESSSAYAYHSMLSSFNYGCITMKANINTMNLNGVVLSAGALQLAGNPSLEFSFGGAALSGNTKLSFGGNQAQGIYLLHGNTPLELPSATIDSPAPEINLSTSESNPVTTAVPEPSAFALSGAALGCLALYRRLQGRYAFVIEKSA